MAFCHIHERLLLGFTSKECQHHHVDDAHECARANIDARVRLGICHDKSMSLPCHKANKGVDSVLTKLRDLAEWRDRSAESQLDKTSHCFHLRTSARDGNITARSHCCPSCCTGGWCTWVTVPFDTWLRQAYCTAALMSVSAAWPPHWS